MQALQRSVEPDRLDGDNKYYCESFSNFEIIHSVLFNSFHTTGLLLYPLKISENQRFSDVFRGIERDQ